LTYTKYPNSIDTSTELPKATDNITPVMAEVVNRLREAIIAIENELGINPSSTYGTVRDRLDAISDGYSDGYTVVVSDGYTVIIDGYNVIIDGYTTLDIYSDGYILASKNALNFSGDGVSTTYDSVNDRINIEISGGGTVDFAAVKAALALADSSIDFANQQLTSIAAPVSPSDGARLQDVLDAITTSEAYTDAAITGITGGITELTQDVLAGDGYGSQAATVVGIQGNPVDSLAPSLNDILTWDGTKWSPAAAPINAITELTQDVLAGDGYGSQIATVVGLYGNPLSNTTPNSGEVLAWNGSVWIPTVVSGGGGGWQVGYSVDFSSLSAQDIKTDGSGGSILIDGKTWNTSNMAGMVSLDVVPGTGIVGSANSGQTCSLWLDIPTLSVDANLADRDVCFLAHIKRTVIGTADNSQLLIAMSQVVGTGSLETPSVYIMLNVSGGSTDALPYVSTYGYGNYVNQTWVGPATEEIVGAWQMPFGASSGNGYYDTVSSMVSSAADLKSCVSFFCPRIVNNPTPIWGKSDPHMLIRWSSGGGTSVFSLCSLKILYR